VIQKYLPRQSYVSNSVRYFFGPVGLLRTNLNVPPQTVDFHRGAEVATGQYTTEAGSGTLVLLSYPTPQIAEERRKAFEALREITDLNFGKQAGFQVKRSGPIVAVTIGDFSSNEAHELLASVNYDADVTWNQDSNPGRAGHNVAVFLITVFSLIGVIIAFALLAGASFGGIRVLSRHLRGRALDGSDEQEFISLDLKK